MERNRSKMLAISMVALMMLSGLAIMFGNTEESDATSGDGETYTYVLQYDSSIMSSGSNAISVADMTPISHTNTGIFESMNAGSWTWNLTTGLGPFNSFYGAFDIDNGNAFVGVLNPNNLGQLLDGTTLASLGGNYNIMWVLPTVYWSTDASGNITLTNDSTAGGTAYAHTIDGHTYNYVAIGVYEATSDDNSNPTKLTSESGKMPLVNKTRSMFRSLADAYTMSTTLGSNAHSMLWNFYQWELYKYCSLAVMENFNSQNTVGNGHAYGSSYAFQTGATDSMTPYAGNDGSITDNTTGASYGSDSVKLFIENAWAGLSEFVDGAIFVGNTGVYIDTSSVPTDANTAGTYVTWNALTMPTSNGFPTQISTTATTWGWGVGSSYSGTATTGLCDITYPAGSSTGDKVLCVGGYSNSTASTSVEFGLSYAFAVNGPTNTHGSFGSRLAFVFDEGPIFTYSATIQSNNTDYGTVSTSTITDIEPGTAITINDNVLTISTFGSVTATPTTNTDQYTYQFTGWYDGSTLLETGDTIDADVTITATFTRTLNQYVVSISSNNSAYGDIDTASLTLDYGTTYTVSDNTVTFGSAPDTDTVTATAETNTAQYTYAFTGWTSGGSALTDGTVSGALSIVANFTQTLNQYTITWSIDGTTTTEQYDYGATPTHEDPTKTGYVFTGWNPTISEVTQDQTYTAVFVEAIPVTVTFDPVKGKITEGPTSKTVLEGFAIGDLPTANRPGYSFTGWFTEPTDGTQVTSETIVTGTEDFTLYAQYELNDSLKPVKTLTDVIPVLLVAGLILAIVGTALWFRYR